MSFTIIQSFVKFSQRSTTTHFQIAVNLLCTFSFVNYMLVFICIFATNHKYVLVRTSAFVDDSAFELIWILCVWTSAFLCTSLQSQWSDCVFSMPVPVLLYLSPFTFTEKFDCDILFSPKVNFVLSVISIITTFVKLSQIILGYINRRCVCRSVYIFERYAFHMIILLLSPTAQWDVVVLLFGETSKRGAEQKLKRKHLNLGRHKAIFL